MQIQREAGFTSKILQQRTLVYVFRLHVKNERWAWYVFEVERPKRAVFEKRFFHGDEECDLEAYGTIHASGWGEEVPLHIQKEMRQRFGLFDISEAN